MKINSGSHFPQAADIKDGLTAAFPIMVGYFPVAMAFGLMAKNINVSFLESCLFSILVFAGASQFMALDLIKAGISAGNIILAVFLLNLRHLIMSASLSARLKEIKKRWILFLAFGVTDETFSVNALIDRPLTFPFMITLHTASYLSWVSGTAAGHLVGSVLPVSVQISLGIGLYALFAALLTPEIKKKPSLLFISALSGAIYIVITQSNILPASWSIIAAIIAASLIGALVISDDGKDIDDEGIKNSAEGGVKA